MLTIGKFGARQTNNMRGVGNGKLLGAFRLRLAEFDAEPDANRIWLADRKLGTRIARHLIYASCYQEKTRSSLSLNLRVMLTHAI